MPRQHVTALSIAALLAAPTLISGIALADDRPGGQSPATPAPAAPAPAAPAQPVAGTVGVPVADAPRYSAGRAELARAYLLLERLMAERGAALDAEALVRVNRGMDIATNYYFAGDTVGTVQCVVDQLGALDPRLKGVAARLGLRPERTVCFTGERRLQARLSVACPLPPGSPGTIDLKILAVPPEGDTEVTTVIGEVHGWDPAAVHALDITLPQPMFRERTRTLRIVIGTDEKDDRDSADVGYLSATVTPVDGTREALARRLDKIAPETAAKLARAITACRARVGTLAETPGLEGTLNLLESPARRVAAVEREVSEIEAGNDPYKGATGDLWVAMGTEGPGLAARLFVPEPPDGADAKAPRPLVIALHGAGGDENLWMSGYGGGNLKDALTRHNAIGVSPQVGLMTFGPATFDAIVESVAAWHPVDRSRVYVIGHSLGGGAAVAWARLRPGQIAGVCSVAGVGTLAGAPKLPRTLIIAAEHDTLCTPARLRADAEKAKAEGLPVEYREIADYGHVLVLGKVTPEAIDWLLGGKTGVDGR